MSTPMRRIRPPCCDCDAHGHAATALPSAAMKSRRRIGHPSCRFIGSLSRPRMQGNGYVAGLEIK
jgi:hypothetical protein